MSDHPPLMNISLRLYFQSKIPEPTHIHITISKWKLPQRDRIRKNESVQLTRWSPIMGLPWRIINLPDCIAYFPKAESQRRSIYILAKSTTHSSPWEVHDDVRQIELKREGRCYLLEPETRSHDDEAIDSMITSETRLQDWKLIVDAVHGANVSKFAINRSNFKTFNSSSYKSSALERAKCVNWYEGFDGWNASDLSSDCSGWRSTVGSTPKGSGICWGLTVC